MRKCITRAFFAMSASAAVAIGLGAAGPASGSVTAPAARTATPQCLAVPNCVTPNLFSPAGSPELALQASADFANAPVIVAADDPTSFSQDWTFIDLGTVAGYQSGGFPNTLGLTGFDFANYGSYDLYQLEFSPGGIPSGYCAANVRDKMVLRQCNGSKFQTFIETYRVLNTWNVTDGWYGLSVAQAMVSAHHLTATGSQNTGTQVYFSRPVSSNDQDWDTDNSCPTDLTARSVVCVARR